jgi:MFS family permease
LITDHTPTLKGRWLHFGYSVNIRFIPQISCMKKESRNSTLFAIVIAVVALVMLVVSNGLAVGGIPVFFKPVQDSLIELGAVSQSEIQSAFAIGPAITIMLAGLAAPLGGILIGRIGFKMVLMTGCLLMGAGLGIYSTAESMPMVYIAHGFLGLSLCFIGVVPASSLVSAWFDRWRGTVLGIVLTGTNFGAILIPWIATPLIVAGDWRSSMQSVSLLVWFVLLPMVLFLVRSRPSPEPAGESAQAEEGMTLSETLRDVRFWILAGAAALIFYCIFSVLQQFNLFMRSDRFSLGPEEVRNFQITLAVATIFGKFVLGFIADYFGSLRTAVMGAFWMMVSTAILWFIEIELIRTFAIAFGFAYGGTFVVLQIIARDLFGNRHFPRILGSIHFIQTLGGAAGLMVTGYLADLNAGDFSVAFKVLAPLMAGATLLLMTLVFFHRRGSAAR